VLTEGVPGRRVRDTSAHAGHRERAGRGRLSHSPVPDTLSGSGTASGPVEAMRRWWVWWRSGYDTSARTHAADGAGGGPGPGPRRGPAVAADPGRDPVSADGVRGTGQDPWGRERALRELLRDPIHRQGSQPTAVAPTRPQGSCPGCGQWGWPWLAGKECDRRPAGHREQDLREIHDRLHAIRTGARPTSRRGCSGAPRSRP